MKKIAYAVVGANGKLYSDSCHDLRQNQYRIYVDRKTAEGRTVFDTDTVKKVTIEVLD